MMNPKTSIAGYAAIACIVLYVAYGFYIGKPMDLEKVLGLRASKDFGS